MKRILLILLSVQIGMFSAVALAYGLRQAEPVPVPAADGPPVTVIDLGTLGGEKSTAVALNNAGQVVGSSSITKAGALHAFVWQEGTMLPLAAPGGQEGRAFDINDQGLIAGTFITVAQLAHVNRPILWAEGVFTPLATLNDGPGMARAVNQAGLVAGHAVSGTNYHLLLWQNEVLTDAGTFIDSSMVHALNDAAQIVGYIEDGTAFLWHSGVLTDLGTLGGSTSVAWDINNKEQIVGSAALSQEVGSHAVLWAKGVITDLGTLDGSAASASEARGINELGAIVGQSETEGEMHAVLWQDGAIMDLNTWLPADSDWDLLITAEDINEAGWIVGTGLIAGEQHGYLLKPITPTQVFLPLILRSTPVLTEPFDMAQFMVGDGRLYEVQHSGGSQARHQTQIDGARFFHTKGNEISAEWEELWAGGGAVWRGTDTSPGNGHYYTLYENGIAGSSWSPRYWDVGDLYERNPYVVFYNKSDCQIVASGFQRSWLLFEAYYPSYTFDSGITLQNVVQLAWLLAPTAAPTERYYYAQDYGLVGWSSSQYGFSYISEIHGPGQRPDNQRETIGCLNMSNLLGRLPADPALNFGPLPPPYRAK